MLKKYLLAQVSQVSAWIGFLLVLGAYIAPRWAFLTSGILLILTDDEWLKGWVGKNAPGITNWLNQKI